MGAPEGNDNAKGHGAPEGPDNGAWEHGVYSDYLRPSDEELMKELSGNSPAEHLKFLIDFNVMRVVRASREIGDPELVVKALDEDTNVHELDMKDHPLARRANEIRRMISDYNEMTEGKDLNVRQMVGDVGELSEEEREQLDEMF